ncbi:MAG: type I phosphomannose isomerase catalytic subunit [Planctomycetota bacterium]|jgi:mannose-6-phosphate isomerase
MPNVYPLKFQPIYKEKIWGGRNLARLFGRDLPEGKKIGESWELADLPEGLSIVANGPAAGKTLTELTGQWGPHLLGRAKPSPDGRFPLLLKLLDANDILSLQVHPDEKAVEEIGDEAVLKTECWYVLDSRDGFIYKGVRPGVTPEEFRKAIETDTLESVVRKIEVAPADFHYLPAGTVHALGAGVVIAEVQTPSDTTYRVTDWSRGREIHVERSLQCVRFELTGDEPPGARGETLLVTDYFIVDRARGLGAEEPLKVPSGCCTALMFISGGAAEIRHRGHVEPVVPALPGDTVLLPAGLEEPTITAPSDCTFLVIKLPDSK